MKKKREKGITRIGYNPWLKCVMIMKFTAILLLVVGLMSSYAKTTAQNTRLNFVVDRGTVKDVIEKVEQQTDVSFMYDNRVFDVNQPISIRVDNKTVNDLMDELLANKDLKYERVNRYIIISTKGTPSSQQQKSVSGKVTDTTGAALPGVSVFVKGTTTGTMTNVDGNYTISVPIDTKLLVFSFIGMQTQEVQIGNKSSINVSLEEEFVGLDEVVAVGYGSQKKRDVTNALTTFKADNLDERPIARIDQALVGQMAGVQVKQTSGTLGRAFSISVRGTGSLSAGNEPLYVIDGFPLATAQMNTSGNFATGNPLDNINTNDIESIQVLKDASSAAIYGSRAANGVVLITTKSGKSGKPKISFNVYSGFSEVTRKIDMLSSEEWIDRAKEWINGTWVASGAGRTASQSTDERRTILKLAPGAYNTNMMIDDRWDMPGHPGLAYIDWQDQILRKGIVQNYQLSASGGTDAVKYYMSANYMKQEGVVIGMDLTNFSARVNVEAQANKNLRVGINLTPTYSETNDPGVEGKDAIYHQTISLSPVQEDTVGNMANVDNYQMYKWSNSRNSPLAQLQRSIGLSKRFRTITSIFGEYQIMEGLKFKTTINLDNLDNSSKSYVPYTVTGTTANRIASNNTLTSGNLRGYKKQTFVNENTLSYNKTFAEKHNVSLMAGASYNSDFVSTSQINSNGGFNTAGVTTLNEAAGWTGTTTESKNVLISYFGRAQYNFSDKYLFSASIRDDGSSRFGSNSKWAIFPSASLAWKISNENFMKGLSSISDLKLRTSWGKAGNYNIGDYATIATLSTYGYAFGTTKVVGRSVNASVNPDLTWEESSTIDVGFDIGFLKNRITGSFDYYDKLNSGLLLYVPIPAVTGFTTTLSNVGKVRNKGWELEITSRNLTGEFSWSTSANLTHNKNKVEALGQGQTQIWVPSSFDIPHSLLRVGEQINSICVVRQIGVLSQADIDNKVPQFGIESAGDPKYEDVAGANGTGPDGKIDDNDRVIVGHPNPDYVWGITNTFKYKGFDLSILVQGQNGGSIYSLLGRAIGRTGQGYVDNYIGRARDRWRSAENPGSGMEPKAYSTFGRIKNTDWLYSSDYIRVRNITIGYDLGTLIKSKQISGGRIYFTAENWFGKDKYTGGGNPEAVNTALNASTEYPEAGDYGGLPLSRSLIIGLNLNF